jgi:hypothetical protein
MIFSDWIFIYFFLFFFVCARLFWCNWHFSGQQQTPENDVTSNVVESFYWPCTFSFSLMFCTLPCDTMSDSRVVTGYFDLNFSTNFVHIENESWRRRRFLLIRWDPGWLYRRWTNQVAVYHKWRHILTRQNWKNINKTDIDVNNKRQQKRTKLLYFFFFFTKSFSGTCPAFSLRTRPRLEWVTGWIVRSGSEFIKRRRKRRRQWNSLMLSTLHSSDICFS